MKLLFFIVLLILFFKLRKKIRKLKGGESFERSRIWWAGHTKAIIKAI